MLGGLSELDFATRNLEDSMAAITANNVVKDAETAVIKLDRVNDSVAMMQTGSANGAAVVFSLYGRINGGSWIGPLEMTNPKSGTIVPAAITTLTAEDKAGVANYSISGFTELWARRTDSDASTAATVYLSAVTR